VTWLARVFALPDGARESFVIDGATLDVAILGLNLPDRERPVGLRHLHVPPDLRGHGRARTILLALIAGAEAHGRPLEADLYPYELRTPDGPAPRESVRALVQAYERLGFVILRPATYGAPVPMAYRPRLAHAA
jgi:GNAT superfamily N-acetyltransferase